MQIFISYRRSNDLFLSGRLSDSLRYTFGEEAVFYDVDSIPYGIDFRDVIRERIGKSDVVLTVIGPTWNARDRLSDDDDWVRFEIEEAFRQRRQIIPLLVAGTPMPDPRKLPVSIRQLTYLNALPVRPDPDFRSDMSRLVESLRRVEAAAKAPKPPMPPPTVAGSAPRAMAPPAPGAPAPALGTVPVTADYPVARGRFPTGRPRALLAVGAGVAAAALLVVALVATRSRPSGSADVLPTSIAATTTTAAPTTTTTTGPTTTAATATTAAALVGALTAEESPWTVACDALPKYQYGRGAGSGDVIELSFREAPGSKPFEVYGQSEPADAAGRFRFSFACGPGDTTAWVVQLRSVRTGNVATLTVLREAAVATTTTARSTGGASTGTTRASSSNSSPAQTTPVTAATTAPQTTIARTTTTLRPPG